MKKDSGWRNYYSIADSETTYCPPLICHKCKRDIERLYLIRNRQNFLHRGNETDERYLYHRECSRNKSVWKEYDERLKREDEHIETRILQMNEVLKLMDEYGLSIEDFCEQED